MRKHYTTLLLCCFISFGIATENDGIIYQDGFESGTLKKQEHSSFRWANCNKTSVVTAEQVVWNNKPVAKAKPHGYDWKPFSGKHALRFRYPEGKNSMSEQRFDLGNGYQELWLSYWLRVPVNYQPNPSSPGNNKLLAIWMDGYSSKGEGPTVVWEFWNTKELGSNLAVHFTKAGPTAVKGHQQHHPFIQYPQDQGRWMHLIFYVKASSEKDKNDGCVRMWRRWNNEESYTLFHEVLNQSFLCPAQSPNGWQRGYLMGWSNPGYQHNTQWLLDDFVAATVSPVPQQLLYPETTEDQATQP